MISGQTISRRMAFAVLALCIVTAGLARAEDKGTIYYLIPTLLDEGQIEAQKAIEKVLPSIGYNVVSLDARNRTDLQLSQLDDVIQRKPKAIILNAVDLDAVVPAIEKARGAGIPVVVFDRQVTGTPVDLSSVAGTVEIGRIAADEAARLLKTRYGSIKGDVLQILGDPGDKYTLDIQKGFEEAMKQYPDVKITSEAAAQWDADKAREIADDKLLANPKIDLIFVHAAHLAVPVVAVLQSKGKKPGDVMLISSNGAPAGLKLIREGWEQVEVEKPTYAQVYGLAMLLDKVIAKEPLQPGDYNVLNLPAKLTLEKWGPSLTIPGAAITAGNVNDSRFWGNLSPPAVPVEVVK